MKWAEICVHTAAEAEEAVANILHDTGANGVVIEEVDDSRRQREPLSKETNAIPAEVVLKAYLPLQDALTQTIERVRERVAALATYQLDVGPGAVTVNEVQAEEWETAWQKYYKPVRISERLVVTPSWETIARNDPAEVVIELDPGMAFGTGTHPSTILSLQALEKVVRGGERVIDVGCGSGILSIAAVKLGAAHVTALDVDAVAVTATRKNAAYNHVDANIDVSCNDLLTGITGTYELIVANILAEVIVRLVADAAARLTPGGTFVTSGIIKAKEDLVREALRAHHFSISGVLRQEDWVAMIARKK